MSDISSVELDRLLGHPIRHSLEYEGTNLPLTFSFPTHCPRAQGKPHVVDLTTGELRPPMCKANLCPYCAKVKCWKIARAVGASDPKAFLTLTHAGDSWKLIQRRMNRLAEHLRERGHVFQWAWRVECYWPGGRHGHHVHAYTHGARIPDDVTFGVEARRLGFGPEFHFSFLTDQPSKGPRYVWGIKKVHEVHPMNIAHHLWINGGRLVHPSRNFWRYGDERMSNMDAVLRAMRSTPSVASCPPSRT
jgi:hypothetical protein